MVAFIKDMLLCDSHVVTMVLAQLAVELCFRIFGRFLENKSCSYSIQNKQVQSQLAVTPHLEENNSL
jgi:hypothetical protein